MTEGRVRGKGTEAACADPGRDGAKAPGRSLGKPTWFKNAGTTNSLCTRADCAQMPHHCESLWLLRVGNRALGLMWCVKCPGRKSGTNAIKLTLWGQKRKKRFFVLARDIFHSLVSTSRWQVLALSFFSQCQHCPSQISSCYYFEKEYFEFG